MPLHPLTEPYVTGRIEVGDGQSLYFERCGTPGAKAAVVLHGGPGSGATPGWRQFFDPARWDVLLFDQRGCGRSTPSAADFETSLAPQTTQNLVEDIEALRRLVGVERWLVLGGSWGATLGLAYTVAHPNRVSEVVLFSVGTSESIEWITRRAARFFPEAWANFRDGAPLEARDGDLADAYARLLESPDPDVRAKAAADWCAWEDAHMAVRSDHKPDPRYDDPRFRMTFARLVTHYWRHDCFLREGELTDGVRGLGYIPAALIHGRLDVSGGPAGAAEIHQAWPGSTLTLVDDGGHGAGARELSMAEAVVEAIAQFAA